MRRSIPAFFLSAGLAATSLSASSQIASTAPDRRRSEPAATEIGLAPVDVPLSDAGLEVMVNGEGPFRFGLDTGQSPAALVSRRFAERLGLPVVDRAPVGDGSGENQVIVDVVRIESLALGAATFRNLEAIVWDMEGDGVVGFTLFADCLLTLDMGRRRIRVESGALPPPDGKTILPLTMDRGVTPSITLALGPRKLPALIDSAWKGCIGVPHTMAGELPLDGPLVRIGTAATLFNEFEITTAPLDGDLRIGDHAIPGPELQFNELLPEVILGEYCLESFAITFDQRQGRIRFVEPDRIDVPPRPALSSPSVAP